LDELARPTTLFAFDFDGTLSKIVHHHHDAQLAASIRTKLLELSRYAPTAILSGRSLDDLRSRVNGAATHLVGNHGLEVSGTSAEALRQARDVCRAWMQQVQQQVGHLFEEIGVTVEDKMYSLAIHYRTVRRKPAATRAIEHLLPLLSPPPRVVPGKAVRNLVPPDAPLKGSALLELLKQQGSTTALYIGDDVTDQDVFRLEDPRVMTARVGNNRTSHAQFYVKHQREVGTTIAYLVRNLKRGSAQSISSS
jgi:trehalose 6-phosphate phosphatase